VPEVLKRCGGFSHLPAAVIGENPNGPPSKWSYDSGSAAKVKRMCGKELPWFNLFAREPSTWDRQRARAVATRFCLDLQEGNRTWTLLLLGRKVCHAFGIERPEWLEWYRSALWGPMIAVPHPSGLNRWYNDTENRRAATKLLSAVAIGLLPSSEREPVTT
jgi:hypothetical protein